MCVYVCERERESEQCVCVCVREREREREHCMQASVSGNVRVVELFGLFG
jgi:hypothetical protein